MTDESLDFELDYSARPKPVQCPNCDAKLDRRIVMSDSSVNVSRPYVTCEQCSAKGKICWA
jgi:predicted nucleic acid-binding Zn ribbon protein